MPVETARRVSPPKQARRVQPENGRRSPSLNRLEETRMTTRTHVWVLALLGMFLGTICGCATNRTASSQPGQEATAVVEAMIEAHGGLDRWASARTVSFEDLFIPAGATAGQPSRVTVEQGRRRSYIDFPNTPMRLAWNGEEAWSENWQMPFPPRFLALLNYYFLNLPWLTMDPGVHLEQQATARLWDDPTDYVTVKMTFGEGVGDSPDDYYVLFIHPETHLLKACRYTVTYRPLVPEGLATMPEHVLVYHELTTVNRLLVPTRYTVFELDQTVYATCEVRNWSFSRTFDEARMVMPDGAVLDTSMD